ncbi:MAG: carbohydrate ABC transporter permease [Clostridia bacterium]|nr:carbohydrate ABC transporter permease [Clostridia bacterium]
MNTKSAARWAKAGKYLLLFLILLFLLFPLYWMLITSFKTNLESYMYPPTFWPKDFTTQSYISLFTENNQFFVYYKNNFIVSALVAAITLIISFMAGYALSRLHVKFNPVLVALLTASQMFPVVSRLISLYSILRTVKLINTVPGLVLAVTASQIPFCTMLMSSFFDGIPVSIEDAANVDGAGRFRTMFSIAFPLVKGGALAVGIYSFLMAWDDFLHAAILIQSDELRTLSVGISARYLGELSYDWSLVNTISIIGILPMLLLFFFFQKYMVKGLVAGAVKG